MPRVPQAPIPGPGLDVAPAFQTAGGVTAAAFGGQIGEALSGLGGTIAQIGSAASSEILKRQAEDNEREGNIITNKIYSELSPLSAQLRSLRGQSALDQSPKIRKQMEEVVKKNLQETTNRAIRRLIEPKAIGLLSREFEVLNRHEEQQRVVANTMASQGALASNLDWVVKNFNQDLRPSLLIASFEGSKIAISQGATDKVAIVNGQQEQSIIVREAIVAAIKSGQVGIAQDIFNNIGGFLQEATHSEMVGMLRDASDLETAQEFAQAIFEQPNTTEEMGLRFLRKRFKGNLERLAVNEYTNLWNERAERGIAIEKQAEDIISSTLYSGNEGNLTAVLIKHPEEAAIVRQSPIIMKRLEAASKAISEDRNYALETDLETWDQLRFLSPENLIKISIPQYRASLTKEDYKILELDFKAAQNTTRSDAKSIPPMFAQGQAILKQYTPGRFAAGTLKEDPVMILARREMDRFVQEAIDQGKILTQKEFSFRANEIMQKISVPSDSFRFGRNIESIAGARSSLTKDQIDRATIEEIEEIRPDILIAAKELIKGSGKKQTDSLIKDVAAAWVLGDLKRLGKLLSGK